MFAVNDGPDTMEEIMLSPQWAKDLQIGKGHMRSSSYLGSGYLKNVFYVSCQFISWIDISFLEHQPVGPLWRQRVCLCTV